MLRCLAGFNQISRDPFVILLSRIEDARASGNTALSSPCWDLLATMRRVVNYHSSWARQRQVELFDASGNPGFIAGRSFNPAGGALGGARGLTVGAVLQVEDSTEVVDITEGQEELDTG
ncbi:hypothetical protein F511_37160 [Dorcoceras hygrometricum]|uniref:Uncharacterized protein n=1 Tax=Dorcoceras hygrometricum TaxID=472368 RepID=A0A2Z7AK08_9LAMI|nr:hypothetical protein F511_37160 [Dorcoceras hygrometricum]